ncbi:hypothetical protein BOVATA_041080 [Babesia ovata]|uniref:Extracellular matrix-binding ebh n=1 Tax=Babesia ovata TaxID=189622 RepID=A0A2H6KI04_9APIC|nr:uncharacterized protein BOVATA_041080 [Babesia ovata]GBE62615.1 hypothetical protein BOVATA_041080 [Babesia ovata]
MAFLGGVLKDVYDKQPYSVGKIGLNDIVSKLNNALCSGHKGFKEVIETVAQGVGEYNALVRDSNNLVKTPIKKLLEDVGSALTDNLNEILPNSVSGTQKTLTAEQEEVRQAAIKIHQLRRECEDYAHVFNDALDIKKLHINDAINDLNSSLSLRVTNAISSVKHEAERLKKLADREKEDIKEMEENTRSVMNALKAGAREKIEAKVNELVRALKDVVTEIFKKLDDINDKLARYVIGLNEWALQAGKDIDAVEATANEIVNKNVGKKHQDIITAKAGHLLNLKTMFGDYIREVTELAGKVNEEIVSLGKQFRDAINGSDLPKTIEKIVEYIKEKVESIKGGVGDPKKDRQPVRDNSIYPNWQQLKGDIIDYVNKIKGEGASGALANKNGIKQIVDGIREYAERFKEVGDDERSGFKSIVYGWLTDILHSAPVMEKLGEYAGGKSDHSTAVAKAIVKQFNSVIGTAVGKGDGLFSDSDADSTKIENYVTAVNAVCVAFAKQLEEHIKKGQVEFSTFSQRIAGDIKDVFSKGTTKPISQGDLAYVIRLILPELIGAARGAAEELYSFAGVQGDLDLDGDGEKYNLGKLLKAIDSNADKINQQFTAGFPGAKIDTALEAVHTEIETLHGQLDLALATASSDPTTIAGHVDQAVTNAIAKAKDLNASHTTPLETLSKEIQEHLSTLVTEISEVANTVNLKLIKFQTDNLKGTGPNQLAGITKNISQLQKELDSVPIKKANQLLTYAERVRNSTISELSRKVDREVSKAQSLMGAHVQQQYIETIKALIIVFVDKVTEDLEELPGLIEHDEHIGVKGFMRKMETEFTKRVESIQLTHQTSSSRDTPSLSQAADVVNKAFGYLFFELQNQEDFKSDYEVMKPSKDCLFKLLNLLTRSQHFDHKFSDNLKALENTLNDFAPKKFHTPNSILLDALKAGMTQFTEQLGHAYVNTYSCCKPVTSWGDDKSPDELTPEGRNCAKVCLTILERVFHDLNDLRKQCMANYPSRPIYSTSGPGVLLHKMGYEVAKERNSNGAQVQNVDTMTGEKIGRMLTSAVEHADSNHHLKSCLSKTNGINVLEILNCLFSHRNQYFTIGHITIHPKPRTPCNIFEMLCWFNGLPHNRVYGSLKSHIKTTLDKPKEHKEKEFSEIPEHELGLTGYPYNVSYRSILTAIHDITSCSHELLTAILGTGDEHTTYSCDHANNSLNLQYPSDPAACFDMLLHVLRGLLPQLKYLFSRCNVKAEHNGWRECPYGKDVPTAKSHCERQSTAEATGQAKCQPTCQANSKAMCQPTSPLMSYLNDCLPGHLPHQLTDVGCKHKCSTCPGSTPGMPCLTPMGFRAFSGSTKTAACFHPY